MTANAEETEFRLGGEARIIAEVVEEPNDRGGVVDLEEFHERYNAGVELAPFGEHWSRDLMLIGHNAIRTELLDLQRLLLSFYKRRFQVGKTEVDKLYEWWDTFVELVGEYFDYEEVVFFPWLTERAQLKPDKYGIHMRLHMKAKLLIVMSKVDDYQQKFMYAATGEKMPELAALLRYLGEALCEYLKYEDKKLKNTIATRYNEADFPHYLKRFEKFIETADNPIELYLFLTRHIRNNSYFPNMASKAQGNTTDTESANKHFKIIPEMLGEEDLEEMTQILRSASIKSHGSRGEDGSISRQKSGADSLHRLTGSNKSNHSNNSGRIKGRLEKDRPRK
mmetsp:Transcript_2848/g.8694  ORF Transcript_2848/g.8694 Transcript_2848/m.8694 type:complete len:337 (+) Transcript_2848:117-1127(+)|eukprot:CAMPEP_0198734532 /NCGR_PEP_ID=MMETSP1475-20131203/53466_1 /TAXON_ID= ORGANISM="Unidentified sp., Strain CCMP1999" /NCGR_SAMPLE_ID=MMETSP1475 /ASSEMBLY_ACC=CAM_ASM_001111 /LENGTH=336 /DNA_ID=CAMNT_0044498033 /DNA_START=95 /DNA_END=1105 /DNA_ORIENTATION=+